MTIYTMNRTQQISLVNWAIGIALVLLLATAALGYTPTPTVAKVGPNALDGNFERIYLYGGATMPTVADSGVNEGIARNATINATVAALVAPGGNVDGNTERLMFGLK